VYRHGKWWLAHCLELDLVADGKSPMAATQDLMELAETQLSLAIEAGNLQSAFRPAPPEIWTMYSSAHDLQVKKKPMPPVKRLEVREAVLT
jgi:hypothetical protein